MSNRNPVPVLLGERQYRRVQQAIELVTHPDSAGGVHVTDQEYALVQGMEADRRLLERWVSSFLAGVQLIRVGFEAPAFQRTLGELRHQRDTGNEWDEDEASMRN